MKHFIIIGNSATGIAGVEAIRERDKQSRITVISDEDYLSYCRCLISYYLAGEVKEEKILYRPQAFYKDNNIQLLLNKKVTRVDPKKNRIVLEDRSPLGYDSLLIASGARPKIPQNIKGINKKGVFGFRTINDAKDIQGLLPLTKAAAVLGGGLIGLKATYALKKRNLDVKVIVKSKQILSQMLDYQAAQFVQRRLEEHGIDIVTGSDVTEVIGNGDIKAVKLDSGKAFGCSLVVAAKGVAPNTDLVKDTPIEVNEGIVVNSLMQTSIPNIYAGGDVCESLDITLNKPAINALWPVAVEQGRAAGANMAGENLNYEGSLGMNSIEFFGLPIISLGIYKTREGDSTFEELKISEVKNNTYKKLILKNNRLLGAILIGDIRVSGILLRLIREKIDVAPFKDELLQENFSFPLIMDYVKDKEKLYV